MSISQSDPKSRFVEQLTGSQRRLYAYINVLLGGDPAVVDVLQDTNLDLWSKVDEFDPNRPFLPWAYRFAYFRVMAHRKKSSRSRLVFDDACVQQLAQRYEQTDADLDSRLAALGDCLEKLPAKHKELIQQRYVQKTKVRVIASQLAQPANRVAVRLFGIRSTLLECIKTHASEAGLR